MGDVLLKNQKALIVLLKTIRALNKKGRPNSLPAPLDKAFLKDI